MRIAAILMLAVTVFGRAAIAQEFVLDLNFDDEIVFDEIVFEDTFSEPDPVGPDVSATLSFGASQSGGMTTSGRALRFGFSQTYDLSGLGILDWSANLMLQDPATPDWATLTLDRLELQNSAGNVSWKIGKYRIGWGEIEGSPTLDVVNGGLSLATVGAASSELPGQWFVSGELFAGDNTFSAFVGLAPEVQHLEPAAPAGREFEFGVSANLPTPNGQISLYGARLLPQTGVVELVSMTSSAAPYTLLGISGYRAMNAVLLEFDLALKSGLERASATALVPQQRIDAAVGIEFAASDTAQITASVMVQSWLEQSQPYFDYGPGGSVAAAQSSAAYLLSASNSFFDDRLSVTLYVGGGLDGSSTFGALSAEFAQSDALKLSLTASGLAARAGSLFEVLDGTKSIGLSAEYFF
ncbi:MAG: hypothetical protein ACC619_00735 [Paracoccaceae bacterium]